MSLAGIQAVLDRADESGSQITFWWRDDDAVAATPELDRLLSLARALDLPIAVAAIPARLEPSLPERLCKERSARILVHGLAHTNHEQVGRKPAEFAVGRAPERLIQDAELALATAHSKAGDLVLPVFVPPWNRFAPALPPALPALGYQGLSAFGRPQPVEGLAVVNTHLDPVDWRGSRSTVAPGALADALARAITDRFPTPIGLLTHHLMFDRALWCLTSKLLEILANHPAVQSPSLDTLWPSGSGHCTVTHLLT